MIENRRPRSLRAESLAGKEATSSESVKLKRRQESSGRARVIGLLQGSLRGATVTGGHASPFSRYAKPH